MQKVIVVSGPVIVKEKKVLLDISGDDNFWKFCGGKVKDGENLKETAIRRANEELGIDVRVIDKKPLIITLPKPGQKEIDVILVHFLAEMKGKIIIGENVKKYDWLEVNNLPQNLAPNVTLALKYFNFL